MSKRWLNIFVIFVSLFCINSLKGQEPVSSVLETEPEALEESIAGCYEEPDTIALPMEVVTEIITEDPLAVEADSVGIVVEIPEYPDWERVSISGKLKMKGLPLSPSLKIFMEKDSSVYLSIRAPFVGEVGRLEISPDSILAVNKMKKTYCIEPLSDFLRYFPGKLGDVQELLLGRIVMPGIGVLSPETADYMDILDNGEELFAVPVDEIAISGVNYGYMIDEQFTPLLLAVIPEGRNDLSFTLEYGYTADSYSMDFMFEEGNRSVAATLEMNLPELDGSAPNPVKIDNKYRRLSLIDFMRSF